eukprot:symbB.v1.2.009565.t1/scaffold598.1/size183230/7
MAESQNSTSDELYLRRCVTAVAKKPTNATELVDIEQQLEQFRGSTLKDMLDEFQDIRAWQQMLYDCEHLLTPRDFKAGSRGEAVFFGG